MTVQTIPAKNIIFKTQSPDAWFGIDYNMNIYRGCPHGCIYCDSRSDCFNTPDFDTVKVKENALEIIRNDLRRKVKTGVIGTGSMSDPYNPLEKELKQTRNALDLINAYGFGVSLLTKSSLVARDADILKDIQTHSPTKVKFTITTADDDLCKKLEPNTATSSQRFEAMSSLTAQGIYCGVLILPLLPYVNDTQENIIKILRMTKDAGGKFVYTYMGMTLRIGSREYYYSHLDNILPGIKEKYMKHFGIRRTCLSQNRKKLWGVFTAECDRLGLLYDMKAITHHYKAGYENNQLTLF
ncbi:MAG: radical SAM protein [Defluviitaleaceae bacterium]|nr:radical SAM protein [Defluviitaleaceae bacterium]